MARAKKHLKPHFTPEEIERLWDEYFAIQLTPEQKEAARAETQKKIDKARADGVYEKLLELAGSGRVQWLCSWEDLRAMDDDR